MKRKIKYVNKKLIALIITSAITLTASGISDEAVIFEYKSINENNSGEEVLVPEVVKDKPQDDSYDFDNKISYEYRLKYFCDEDKKGSPYFTLGTDVDLNKYNSFMNSELAKYYDTYGNTYGIDPFLGMAKAYQETRLGHYSFIDGGSAIGISQIERSTLPRQISVYNYEINTLETFEINASNLRDPQINIKAGMAILANKLAEYGYRPDIGLQAYNYNNKVMNQVIENAANEKGVSVETILADTQDMTYLSYVQDAHNNPAKYVNGWGGRTYGDGNYVDNVFSHYIGNYIWFRDKDNKYLFNLEDNSILSMPANVVKTR